MTSTAFDSLGLCAPHAKTSADLQHMVFDADDPRKRLVLVSVAALTDLQCGLYAATAIAATATMRHSEAVAKEETTRPRGTPGCAAAPVAGDIWSLRVRRHEASQELVRLHLQAAARGLRTRGLHGAAEELEESVGQVGTGKVTAIHDVPAELRGPNVAARDPRWRLELFSEVLEAPVTNPLPVPRAQPAPTWRPATTKDLLTPEAWVHLQKWLELSAKDVRWMRRHGSAQRPFKPKPLVLAQSDMVPEARGVVWDLRRAAEGIIEPWDFTAPITSDLNIRFLEVLLSSCPDRELVGHIIHGVHAKADLPLQTVLLPHMDSLGGHVELCEREIDRLMDKGWARVFSDLPALPCRMSPCGAVARKHEAARPRRVVNASAPHTDLVDVDGVPVTSLNAAIKAAPRTQPILSGHDPGERTASTSGAPTAPGFVPGVRVQMRADRAAPRLASWDDWRETCRSRGLNPFTAPGRPAHLLPSTEKLPKERKPTIASKMHDIAILQHAASVFGEEVVGMSTDFADYFSQLAHSQADLWTQAVHWARDEGVDESKLGICVLDLRLGFGASHGSNVSQRLSHALGAVFRTVNDARETEYLKEETDPARLAYLQERRNLGHGQCRLWELSTYTDDPFLVVVGAKRLARAMELWNRLVKALGLAVAIPAKRQCGATIRWLGLDFFLTLGIVVIPDNKRLRMLRAVDSLAAGTSPPFAEYRSSVSFLQYLKPFVEGADSSFFYGLYEPFKRRADGSLPEASDPVVATPLIREQCARWAGLLRSTSGMFCASGLRPRPPSPATPWVYLYSDAALEGTSTPGLGGYMHGFYWCVELVGDERLLPISVLELIAIGINLIVFESFTKGANVRLCSDSLNSVQVLTNLRAKSILMAYVHRQILALPQAKAIGGSTSAIHCYGPANPAADAISRGNLKYFALLCAQLGVHPSKIDVPASARVLLDGATEHARALGILAPRPTGSATTPSAVARRSPAAGVRFGEASHPGPSVSGLVPVPTPLLVRARARWPLEQQSAASGPARAPVRQPRECSPPTDKVPSRAPTRSAASAPAAPSPSQLAPATLQRAPKRPLTTDPERSSSDRAKARARTMGAPASFPGNVAHWPLQQADPQPPPGRARGRGQAEVRREKRLGAVHERAQNLIDLLASDTSGLALRPANPDTLQQVCMATLNAAEEVPAEGTLRTDDLAWERWCWYCARMGTAPVRMDLLGGGGSSQLTAQRETVLLSGFLLLMADTMTGRGGKGSAKPQSAFQMVLAVRRIHERLGARLEVLPGVRKVFDSIVKNFVRVNGAEALVPKRKEPLDAQRLTRMFSLPNGTRLGAKVLAWNEPYWVTWRALLSVGFGAAFRKAEMVLPAGTKLSVNDLTRASVSWIIAGRQVASPTDEQLAGLAAGDFCVIKPPTSKADPFGLHFTWKPIFLPFDDTAANAARNMATFFRVVSVAPDRRLGTPLFCLHPDGTTFTQAEVDHLLQHMLKAAFPDEDPKRWSMHSLRIGAATALLKAHASMELIQALCRWRSPKSVGVYARLGPADYGLWLARAQKQHVDAITARNLPRFDYDGIIGFVAGGLEEWDAN